MGVPLRCFRAVSAAARFVDEAVVLGAGHVAVVLHARSCLLLLDRLTTAAPSQPSLSASSSSTASAASPSSLDPPLRLDLPGQLAAQSEQAASLGVLLRCFPSPVLSVALENSRLSVVLRDGSVHVWQWEAAKNRWNAVANALKLASASDLVLEAAEWLPNNVGWLCLESSAGSSEVTLSRKGASGNTQIVTVPGDGASARLWLSKDSAVWIWSEYGGLCCVNLSDPKPFCPPSFYSGFLEQHPNTRELVWLQLPECKLWLLRPFAAPEVLCTLSGILLSNVKSMFLQYQMVGVIDESGLRCSIFDLGSGCLLRSFSLAAVFSAARVAISAPFVMLWSRSAGLMSLQPESVSQVQALLPPARGAKMAQV